MKRGNKPEQGFTIIEVVVALTVIAIGILGLAIVFPLSMEDVGKSGSATKAVELCKQKLEDFHMIAYDAPQLEAGYTHADSLNPIDGVYVRTWEVTDDVPIEGCKFVTVSVTSQVEEDLKVEVSTVLASAGR